MKKIYKILIIIVFVFLFFYLNQFFHIYNKSVEYLGNRIFLSLYNYNQQDYSRANKNKNLLKITNLTPKVIEPGILNVQHHSLSFNNTNLSSKDIIDLTNHFRKEDGGLNPLKENPKLDFTAEEKLKDMFTKQYFQHISPTGIGVVNLVRQVSYGYIIIGENLALGNFKDDKTLVDAWMASPEHRANILNKNYSETGVAVGKGFYKGENVWIAVQHFGLPRNVCPTINKILGGIVATNEQEIKTMKNNFSIRLKKISEEVVYEGLTINEQIKKYNSLALVYNQLIINTKKDIDQYNKQVESFNSCMHFYLK